VSQYFYCVVAANKELVRRHPIAAKRALRAMLKGADICAQDPERAARYLVQRKYEPRYEVSLSVLKLCPLARVRPGGHGALPRPAPARGRMIKSTPQKIIAQGTDWRFWNELKRELKA